MQFKDSELNIIRRALRHYLNDVVAHEDLLDEAEEVLQKVKKYQVNYSIEE